MSDKPADFLEEGTEPLPLGEWFDDLIWTPSQCYYHLQHKQTDYILYLRWRWTNPWQAYIVKNAARLSSMNNGKAVWSGDVFELHRVHLKNVELDRAKNRIISLFYEFEGNFTPLRLLLPNR